MVVLSYLDVSARVALLVMLSLYCLGDHLDLHSFPTRRSSDLEPVGVELALDGDGGELTFLALGQRRVERESRVDRLPGGELDVRSEEHTSELQSRENLVCRLLLEKKKKPRHTCRYGHGLACGP